MHHIQLGPIDYLILTVYFAFVLGIGWALKRYMKTSLDFLLSGPFDSRLDYRPGLYLGQSPPWAST